MRGSTTTTNKHQTNETMRKVHKTTFLCRYNSVFGLQPRNDRLHDRTKQSLPPVNSVRRLNDPDNSERPVIDHIYASGVLKSFSLRQYDSISLIFPNSTGGNSSDYACVICCCQEPLHALRPSTSRSLFSPPSCFEASDEFLTLSYIGSY